MRAEAEDSRRVADPGRGPQRAPAPGAGARDARGQLARSRDQLIALIPAEAVALFILLIGLTAQEAVGWRVGILVGVSLFAVAWTVLSYWEAKGGRQGASLPAFEMVVGVVAFLAWSTSVPASPFVELDLPSFVGALIVAVVSAGLVFAARLRAIWAKPARQP